jgi:hypothetical protein
MRLFVSEGWTLEEVGALFDVDPYEAAEILRENRLPGSASQDTGLEHGGKDTYSPASSSRLVRGASADRRAEQAYELYKAGATLAEVGERYGVSRERVRQIFRDHGFRVRSIAETRALQRDRQIAEHAASICECFREHRDIGEVAKRLNLPEGLVKEVIKTRFSKAQRRKPKATSKRYSDEELIGFLQETSRALGGVLTVKGYNDYARGRQTADGRPWPTNQTHGLRFGSWHAALTAAGLAANPSSPIAGRTLFDDGHCIDALRAAARELGRPPTAEEYDGFARASNGGLPSQATVRIRLGGWYQALSQAGL